MYLRMTSSAWIASRRVETSPAEDGQETGSRNMASYASWVADFSFQTDVNDELVIDDAVIVAISVKRKIKENKCKRTWT